MNLVKRINNFIKKQEENLYYLTSEDRELASRIANKWKQEKPSFSRTPQRKNDPKDPFAVRQVKRK